MITIRKNHEPVSLTQYRAGGGKKYDNLDSNTKNDIRDSLLKEQGYLCAYCMNRIGRRNGADNYKDVKIEHVKPRSVTQKSSDPHINMLEIDYGNMVAVCSGVTNGTFHCDTSKGDTEIHLHPCDPGVETSIRYGLKDGTIQSTNELWNEDITNKDKLNLNHPTLKNNRKAALDGMIQYLNTATNWSAPQLTRMLEKLDHNSPKMPYTGILKYYLKKKIAQKK